VEGEVKCNRGKMKQDSFNSATFTTVVCLPIKMNNCLPVICASKVKSLTACTDFVGRDEIIFFLQEFVTCTIIILNVITVYNRAICLHNGDFMSHL
jgi:hypothetical protein